LLSTKNKIKSHTLYSISTQPSAPIGYWLFGFWFPEKKMRPSINKKVYAIVEMSDHNNYLLCLPDEHIERILDLLDNEANKKTGFIHLTDKNSVVHKFFKQGTTLIAERDDNGKPMAQPVISISEAKKMREAQRPIKEKITERILSDFPEKTKEEVEADADILAEANESIKKLIASGVAPSVARKIIASVLDCEKAITSPEELAELMKSVEEAEHKEKEE
jgi:hypothetical protein